MIRSVPLRRLLSAAIMVMLVWCQTSAAAFAGLSALSGPGTESATVLPCHATAADNRGDNHKQRDSQKRCQSRDASYETAKVHLPAIDDLLLAVGEGILLEPVVLSAAPCDRTAERAAPPPLILVYCRLLI